MKNIMIAMFTIFAVANADACEKLFFADMTVSICKNFDNTTDYVFNYSESTQMNVKLSPTSRLLGMALSGGTGLFHDALKQITIDNLNEYRGELQVREPELQRLMQMMVEMLPADEEIPSVAIRAAVSLKRSPTAIFNMICDRIGSECLSSFTADGEEISRNVMVGTVDNSCMGRCGARCSQPLQSSTRQYTQECLNHDLCTAVVGSIFGQCLDEWYAASDGYLLAPECP